jgi:hypothetical protein
VIAAIDRMRTRFGDRTLSRVVSVPLALGSGGILTVARWLEPSPAGHGTHLQLGLRPCSVLTWTGYPCPMCGATTTFALMADFRPLDALINQPFAVVLFVLCVLLFGVAAAEVVQPRDRWTRLLAWIEPVEGWAAGGFLLAMGAGWAWKIAHMVPSP